MTTGQDTGDEAVADLISAMDTKRVVEIRIAEHLSGPRFHQFTCQKCAGTGERSTKWSRFTCPSCGGSGSLFRELELIEDRQALMARVGHTSAKYRTGWR